MTCYFRHIQSIFDKASVEITKENKREIDKIIHEIVGCEYKNCSSVWRALKRRIAENESGFVSELNKAVSRHL